MKMQTQNEALSLIDPAVAVGSLKLKNAVLTASGTFGYGVEYNDVYDPAVLGGVMLKALSMKPRAGNPPTRIYETPSGMLNSIGLQNVGIEDFFTKKEADCARLRSRGVGVIANLAGSTVEEFCQLLARLDASPHVDAYEINVSCPNVKEGGCQFGQSEAALAELAREIRPLTARPLIIKLSPQVSDIVRMARICADAGADAVSLINTFPAMAIDAERRRPVLATVTGGLSGPAIKPVALRMVHAVHRAVGIPIIGMGGIMTPADAVEFLLAGASAIAVGTANFVDPLAPVAIISGLEDYCRRHGFDAVAKLTGALEIPS